MGDISERNEPFQLKGGSLTTVVLKLIDPEDGEFFSQLTRRIRQAPGFFKNAPVIIDLDDLSPACARFDVIQLGDWLRQQEMVPIGIHGGTVEQQIAASAAGLPVVPSARPARTELGRAEVMIGQGGQGGQGQHAGRTDPLAAPPAPAVTIAQGQLETAWELPEPGARASRSGSGSDARPPTEEIRRTMIVQEPVRSGRRIYAPRGDLIVLAPVSPGAELLADGHIHVYSTLRGRALAGLKGDRSARIFCQSLEAELISIAGLYRVSEDIEKAVFKKSVQIFLEADRLRMDVLS